MAIKNMKAMKINIYAVIIFLFTFILLMITIKDYGLIYDEYHYTILSDRIESWLKLFLNKKNSKEAEQRYLYFDRYFNGHPPFINMSGILFRNIVGKLFYKEKLFSYRISTAFWSAMLITFLFLYFYKTEKKIIESILSSFVLLFLPYYFFYSHFLMTDIVLCSLTFITIYFFFFYNDVFKGMILPGIFLGFTLATKFTGLLILPILFLWICYKHDLKKFRDLVLIVIISAIIVYIISPPIWLHPLREFIFYFLAPLRRFEKYAFKVIYFGKKYKNTGPWHHPFVMIGITTPFVLIFCFFIGLMNLLKNSISTLFKKSRNFFNLLNDDLFFLIPIILLMGVYVTPFSPSHETRLYSQIWPFFVIFSIKGINSLISKISVILKEKQIFIKNSILFFILGLEILNIIKYHPYQISYYNKLIGGPSGANAKGFEITRFEESFNRAFINKMESVFENFQHVKFNHRWDILKANRDLGVSISKKFLYCERFEGSDVFFIQNFDPEVKSIFYDKNLIRIISTFTPDNTFISALMCLKGKIKFHDATSSILLGQT